ncbi:MAG TPA: hypothetical protein VFA89_04280 [Terriglobales bacterium]|nr:hypothetical protein [Terriglobales bacterium]
MSEDKRDLLEVLKFELSFLEQGGYGRSVRTPWKPTAIFRDSLSCLNFNEPDRPHPCSECVLTDLVPVHSLEQDVPCHFIPLNKEGETVDSMERQYNQVELEDAVRNWLRSTIKRLEAERAAQKAVAD